MKLSLKKKKLKVLKSNEFDGLKDLDMKQTKKINGASTVTLVPDTRNPDEGTLSANLLK